MAAGVERYRYDAFVSYAHEDLEAATWIADVIAKTWVPGVPRRKVFLDRRAITSRGVLDAQIREALSVSQTLVVLASRHSAKSEPVADEIDEFVRSRVTPVVMICRVGSIGDDAIPPRYLALHPVVGVEGQLVADLRGPWPPRERASRRARRDAAMSVVAGVAGMKSADELHDVRLRWQRRALVIGDVLSAVISIWLALHTTWVRTPQLHHEQAVAGLVEDAAIQQLDEPQILAGLAVLLEEGRKRAFDDATRFVASESTTRLARAMRSAYTGECEEATAFLAGKPAIGGAWRDIVLGIASRCSAPRLFQLVRPIADAEPDPAWAIALARAGWKAEAWRETERLSGTHRALAATAVALETGQLERMRVPTECGDDADVILDLAEHAHRADVLGRSAPELVLRAAECTSRIAITTEHVWNRDAQLAAALAGIGEREGARAFLEHLTAFEATPRTDVIGAIGLAWLAVAHARLGEPERADARFANAIRVLFTPSEASRSWNEATEVVMAFAIVGRWIEAFELAAAIPDARGRTRARLRLLAHWHDVGNHQTWASRWAPTLSTVLLAR